MANHPREEDPLRTARALEKARDTIRNEVDPFLIPVLDQVVCDLSGNESFRLLHQIPPERIAAVLAPLCALIITRSTPVALRLFPLCPEKSLLITNTDDAPYLIDTLHAFFQEREIGHAVLSHPIFPDASGETASSLVILIDRYSMYDEHEFLLSVRHLLHTLIQWDKDRDGIVGELRDAAAHVCGAGHGFFDWLLDGNFLLLSFRRYRIGTEDHIDLLDAGGIKDIDEPVPSGGTHLGALSQAMQRRLSRDTAVLVEPVEALSPVHRREPLTYIGIRDNQGIEHAFSGLLLAQSWSVPARSIIPLRDRLLDAIDRVGVRRGSHDFGKIFEIFDNFPKIEFFFLSDEELDALVRCCVSLKRQGAVKIVPIRSLSRSGLTLMLIMPGGFFSPEGAARLEAYLCRHCSSPYAEIRFVHGVGDYLTAHVRLKTGRNDDQLDIEHLERALTALLLPWRDRLRHLLDRRASRAGRTLWKKYAYAFEPEYLAIVHPRFAVRDIDALEELFRTDRDSFVFWGPFAGDRRFYRLQFYSLNLVDLNRIMPLLENLNLTVRTEVDFTVHVEGRTAYIKSFEVVPPAGLDDLKGVDRILTDALDALWSEKLENDYLNRLMVLTGLDWKRVDLFRGYRSYYFQLGTPFTKKRVAYALINNPELARLLYDYFDQRFNPAITDEMVREEGLGDIRMGLIAALEKVSDVNEDRILRTFFNLIDSTVRTNFFRRVDESDYFHSFKIGAIGIIDMPAPRPLYEIFVHANHMEGIHLRGGTVARGGLRWSERPDDFRTEILGLMKTQMTKNALIVPVGSKGGFVLKQIPDDPALRGEAVLAGYRTLIRGLLDLTDNRVGEEIVRPGQVVCCDEPDPYLVVAADKGTATFSDVANGISREYGFWLDDAFASGGSEGYDHKKLGITARGAWEAVKCHFREMGVDTQSDPVMVVGIGDMSGDVFGNGMLLSRSLLLKGAFNHRHIFIDPSPDAEASFRERERLFNLPRSGWNDYDTSLISEGGGVFLRSAKDIPVSQAMREWLGIRYSSIDGDGLVRALLKAKVDLLWNGGIGTYVRASTEKDDDVGDRSNDAVRIDATMLRAKVIGEGGNLGFTQNARIEFALLGGCINTDAVDNSGGVDCSDHEVNLKIFLRTLIDSGDLKAEDRNRLLESCTDDVCHAVLQNNYGQTTSLSLDSIRCAADRQPFIAQMNRLTDAGMLDRKGERLPSVKELSARPVPVFTRPELAILMSYSKMQLYQALLEVDDLATALIGPLYRSYYPQPLLVAYGAEIDRHPLRREIAATVATNFLIDRTGCSRIAAIADATEEGIATVAQLYLLFDRLIGAEEIRAALHRLDLKLPAEEKYRSLQDIEETLGRMVQQSCTLGIGRELLQRSLDSLQEGADLYRRTLPGILSASRWEDASADAARLQEYGMEEQQAHDCTLVDAFAHFVPVYDLAANGDIAEYSRFYFEVRSTLAIDDLAAAVDRVPVRQPWDRETARLLKARMDRIATRLTQGVAEKFDGNIEAYLARHRQRFRNCRDLSTTLIRSESINLNPFVLLVERLESLLT